MGLRYMPGTALGVQEIPFKDEDPPSMEQILLHHPPEHSTYRPLHWHRISEIEEPRAPNQAGSARLDTGVRCIVTPYKYHISLTHKPCDLKQERIQLAN